MMQNNETKPVIKIFVSHRIDQVSETIDNPLYVNVRCGAVYDKRNPEEYGLYLVMIQGIISLKREVLFVS